MTRCWADSWFYDNGRMRLPSETAIGYGIEPRSSCLLDDGHEGDHEWTPDSEIVLEFSE